MNWLRVVASRTAALLVVVILWTWAATKLVVTAIGATTVGEDFNLLLAEKLPKLADWLFSTPWWVPSLLASALTVFVMWLSWPTHAALAKPIVSRGGDLRDTSEHDDPIQAFEARKVVSISLNYSPFELKDAYNGKPIVHLILNFDEKLSGVSIFIDIASFIKPDSFTRHLLCDIGDVGAGQLIKFDLARVEISADHVKGGGPTVQLKLATESKEAILTASINSQFQIGKKVRIVLNYKEGTFIEPLFVKHPTKCGQNSPFLIFHFMDNKSAAEEIDRLRKLLDWKNAS